LTENFFVISESIETIDFTMLFPFFIKSQCWQLPSPNFYNGVGIYYNGEIFVGICQVKPSSRQRNEKTPLDLPMEF
jgi:hypothetical protein